MGGLHASFVVDHSGGMRRASSWLCCSSAAAAAATAPYGEPVTLEQAKKIAAAAEAEAKKINVNDTIAIVEPHGQVVFFQRMDGNQDLGNLAIDRAKSAALFRRPTTASDPDKAGGFPIVIDGKLIGGIGISGGSGPQTAQLAEAGLAAIK